MNKIFSNLKKLFYPTNNHKYEFSLPDNDTKTNEIVNDEINSENDPKNIFPVLSINMDFLKTKYNQNFSYL